MSTKYHITDNGEPGVCRASVRECPVGGAHYDSPDAAREGYEKAMGEAAGSLQSLQKERPEESHCYVCRRHTDHRGEHDALVDAGLAAYDGYDVVRTPAYTNESAKVVNDAEYARYSLAMDAREPLDTPEIAKLREELKALESSPARNQYGLPEDEMVRYNVEQAIAGKRAEIKALDPDYDHVAERDLEAATRAAEIAISNTRFQNDPDRAYKRLEVSELPPPGSTFEFEDVAVLHVQYNKATPGIVPTKASQYGSKSVLVPNAGRMTSRKKLALANELAVLSGRDLEAWDASSDEAKMRWLASRMGKKPSVSFEVHQDGRVSWTSRYSSSSNYAPEDVILVKSL